jgi:hypothetical protein
MKTEYTVEELLLMQRKRARITAFVLSTSLLISVIFLVYSIIQKTDADSAKAFSEKIKTEAFQQRIAAEKQMEQSNQAQMQLRKQLTELEALLVECQVKK